MKTFRSPSHIQFSKSYTNSKGWPLEYYQGYRKNVIDDYIIGIKSILSFNELPEFITHRDGSTIEVWNKDITLSQEWINGMKSFIKKYPEKKLRYSRITTFDKDGVITNVRDTY